MRGQDTYSGDGVTRRLQPAQSWQRTFASLLRAQPDAPIWQGWHRHWLLMVAASLVVLTGIGIAAEYRSDLGGNPPPANPRFFDHQLYEEVIGKVVGGEDYYTAVAASHRAHNYPLKPLVTVRAPTLALLWSKLGTATMQMVIAGLACITAFAWWHRLREDAADIGWGGRIAGLLLTASGFTFIAAPEIFAMHETWAGVLIALALAFYHSARPLASIVLILLACFFRETALPALLLLSAFALVTKCGLRTSFAALGLWALFYGYHAVLVAAIPPHPGDLVSPGWATAGGWPLYLDYVRETSILRFFSPLATAIIVPLALAGWTGWRSDAGVAMACVQIGYALLFMLIGRPENFYCRFLILSLLLLGLVKFPAYARQALPILRRAGRHRAALVAA